MNPMDDWLRITGTHGVLLARTALRAPWGVALPASSDCVFHFIVEGHCWLLQPGHDPLPLAAGDLVLVPQGHAHSLLHHPTAAAQPIAHIAQRQTPPPGAGPLCRFACGAYRSLQRAPLPWLRTLPSLLHLPHHELTRDPSLSATSTLLLNELALHSPGAETLLPALFDALLVYVMRYWAAHPAAPPGWWAALQHPALSQALQAIHAQPQAPWTVASLARLAGLSRAAFARNFTQLLGQPPLAYLTAWRLRHAARLLVSSSLSLAQVASQSGYQSEFAFSRAFKRHFRVAPTHYRHQASAPPS